MSDIIAGRAELLDPLAHGATGTLWRALDLRYDQICAGKVMRQRDGYEVLRFVREQSVGARGEHAIGPHPHLVLPYAWAAEDDAVVLLMPLLHGGTVEQALADHGPLHPLLVLEIIRQLLDGLAAVHAANWVHRDIKPANLLLEVTGANTPHVRLADFGIALHRDDARLTATGMVPGTPGYFAPELLYGHPASPAQDLWAAGVIALLALDPATKPTADENPETALKRAFSGPAGMLPGARELAGVIRRLLAIDPADRGSAAEARDAIRRPTGPPSSWVLTACGEPFEVFDQIESPPSGSPAASRAEVPNDGPDAQCATSHGLHDRLAQRARETAPAASPSVPPPIPNWSPPAAGQAATPTPVGPTREENPRSTSHLWPIVVLIVITIVALLTAAALAILAARADRTTAEPSAGTVSDNSVSRESGERL